MFFPPYKPKSSLSELSGELVNKTDGQIQDLKIAIPKDPDLFNKPLGDFHEAILHWSQELYLKNTVGDKVFGAVLKLLPGTPTSNVEVPEFQFKFQS